MVLVGQVGEGKGPAEPGVTQGLHPEPPRAGSGARTSPSLPWQLLEEHSEAAQDAQG